MKMSRECRDGHAPDRDKTDRQDKRLSVPLVPNLGAIGPNAGVCLQSSSQVRPMTSVRSTRTNRRSSTARRSGEE